MTAPGATWLDYRLVELERDERTRLRDRVASVALALLRERHARLDGGEVEIDRVRTFHPLAHE